MTLNGAKQCLSTGHVKHVFFIAITHHQLDLPVEWEICAAQVTLCLGMTNTFHCNFMCRDTWGETWNYASIKWCIVFNVLSANTMSDTFYVTCVGIWLFLVCKFVSFWIMFFSFKWQMALAALRCWNCSLHHPEIVFHVCTFPLFHHQNHVTCAAYSFFLFDEVSCSWRTLLIISLLKKLTCHGWWSNASSWHQSTPRHEANNIREIYSGSPVPKTLRQGNSHR